MKNASLVEIGPITRAEKAEAEVAHKNQVLREAKQHLESYLQGESGLPFVNAYTAIRNAAECIDSGLQS